MGLTRQRKAILGVLGLSGLSLVMDRAFFAPAEAGADSVVEPAEADLPQRTDPAVAPVALADSGTPPLRSAAAQAARLREAAERFHLDPRAIDDVFRPRWLAMPAAPAAEAVESLTDAAAFVAQHRLSAVMGSGPNGHAIVNGRLLRVGEVMGGYRLEGVGERLARFSSDGETAELRVDEPAVDPRGGSMTAAPPHEAP
jgi:hypothetical protein